MCDTSCKLAPYTLHTLGFFAKLLLYKQTASTQKLHKILWSKCIVCYIYHAHKGIGEMGSRGTICWRKWVWKWKVGGGNEAHEEDNGKASGNRCNPNTHMNSVRPPISCELFKGIKVLIGSQNYASRFSFSPKDCKFAMQNWVMILSSGSDVPNCCSCFRSSSFHLLLHWKKKSPLPCPTLPLPPHPIYVAALMMVGW